MVMDMNKRKKVVWKMQADKKTFLVDIASSNCDEEDTFSFEVERYKDDDTHEESLKITCKMLDINSNNFVDNGFIITTAPNLESDIKQLWQFGVVIEASYLRDLANRITLNYLKLPINKIATTKGDKRFGVLIEYVKSFVDGSNIYIKGDSCYVPINDFNGLAEDCGYKTFEMKMLREQLHKDGYIRKLGDRYTNITRLEKDRPERVIEFDREKLGVELPKKKEKPQTSTSGKRGTDEKA